MRRPSSIKPTWRSFAVAVLSIILVFCTTLNKCQTTVNDSDNSRVPNYQFCFAGEFTAVKLGERDPFPLANFACCTYTECFSPLANVHFDGVVYGFLQYNSSLVVVGDFQYVNGIQTGPMIVYDTERHTFRHISHLWTNTSDVASLLYRAKLRTLREDSTTVSLTGDIYSEGCTNATCMYKMIGVRIPTEPSDPIEVVFRNSTMTAITNIDLPKNSSIVRLIARSAQYSLASSTNLHSQEQRVLLYGWFENGTEVPLPLQYIDGVLDQSRRSAYLQLDEEINDIFVAATGFSRLRRVCVLTNTSHLLCGTFDSELSDWTFNLADPISVKSLLRPVNAYQFIPPVLNTRDESIELIGTNYGLDINSRYDFPRVRLLINNATGAPVYCVHWLSTTTDGQMEIMPEIIGVKDALARPFSIVVFALALFALSINILLAIRQVWIQKSIHSSKRVDSDRLKMIRSRPVVIRSYTALLMVIVAATGLIAWFLSNGNPNLTNAYPIALTLASRFAIGLSVQTLFACWIGAFLIRFRLHHRDLNAASSANQKQKRMFSSATVALDTLLCAICALIPLCAIHIDVPLADTLTIKLLSFAPLFVTHLLAVVSMFWWMRIGSMEPKLRRLFIVVLIFTIFACAENAVGFFLSLVEKKDQNIFAAEFISETVVIVCCLLMTTYIEWNSILAQHLVLLRVYFASAAVFKASSIAIFAILSPSYPSIEDGIQLARTVGLYTTIVIACFAAMLLLRCFVALVYAYRMQLTLYQLEASNSESGADSGPTQIIRALLQRAKSVSNLDEAVTKQLLDKLLDNEHSQQTTADSSDVNEESIRRHIPKHAIIPYAHLEFTRRIAAGTYGVVFEGVWKVNHTTVAIKKLIDADTSTTRLFLEEATMLSMLRHPNIVMFMGISLKNEGADKQPSLLIVTEYLPRGNLENLLRSESTISWNIKLKICLGVARALLYIHSLEPKILHRDLKSKNILVDEDHNAKLCDFGMAQQTEQTADSSLSGTIEYMSPESLDGNYSEKSDIYSFGILMWEVYYQRIPYYQEANKISLIDEIKVGKRPTADIDPHAPIDSSPALSQNQLQIMPSPSASNYSAVEITVPQSATSSTPSPQSSQYYTANNRRSVRPQSSASPSPSQQRSAVNREVREQYMRLMEQCWEQDSSRRPQLAAIIAQLKNMFI